MKKRILVSVAIIWALFSIVSILVYTDNAEKNKRAGSFTTGISYEDKMYIADKREEGAFVYAFNSEKKVKHLRSVSDMSFES
ncbi:MAG: hypothetical protein K6F00_08195, partial [Lachnospiraceae bacterium]|nr:hypothetical protein [Lachnospiraceae bacterium]